MPTPPASGDLIQGELVAQDDTQVLQRLFTGHIVAMPATGNTPLVGTVVSAQGSGTSRTVTVRVTGFTAPNGAPPPTLVCKYNLPTGTTTAPPATTPVLVCFPANDPYKYGWAIGFLGWP
jgi:hypothetical protein